MKKLSHEWLEAAKDDLLLIEEILDRESLTHMVAFHAQQCVEKCMKALLEEYEIEIPKIHKLVTLAGMIEKKAPFRENYETLKKLDALYIEARYPGELGLLPNGKPTINDSRLFFDFARNFHTQTGRILSSG